MRLDIVLVGIAVILVAVMFALIAFFSVFLSGGSAREIGYQWEDYIIPAIISPIGLAVIIIGLKREGRFH